MKRDLVLRRIIKSMLIVLSLAVGQNVWAVNGWKVEATTSGSTTTFTISRTNKTVAETVKYRLVNLSAYAGQHYNVTKVNGQSSSALSGNLTFAVGDDKKTILVTEYTSANTDAYNYHNGIDRSYKLEVTDVSGFFLADKTRSFTTGTQFSTTKVSKSITDLVYFNGASYASGLSSSKYLDVSYTPPTSDVETKGTFNGYVLIDDSYDYGKKPATVSTSSLISSTGATANYLKTIGYKIYATVCFTEKEKDDGYAYVQILAGTSSYSYDGADPNGSVNTPVNSLYKACFELQKSTTVYDGEGKQFFPHRYDYANRTAGSQQSSHTEFYLADGYLWGHSFKNSSYQASNSGSLVLDADVSNITTRFDCGGSGDDTWGYKDLFVRMALCDATAPNILDVNSIVVAGGIYGYGNTVYISVPFNEVVTVSGTPTLSTTWGTLSYYSGSGSNVLTFSGVISANEGTSLTVNSISGTVKDLAGNLYNTNTSINKSFSILTVVSPWTGSGTENDPYIISSTWQLDCLAKEVWGGYTGNPDGKSFSDIYFKLGSDIEYSHSNDDTWDKTSSFTSNFTSIGGYGHSFRGSFDGDGHSISGIRIYKNGSANSDECQGLFGMTYSGSMVKNLVLYDINIVGKNQVGVVVGSVGGTIQDCYVYNSRIQANSGSSKGIINGSGSATITRAYYKDCLIGSGGSEYNIAHLTLNGGATVTRTGGTTVNASLTTYGDGITLSSEEYYTKNTDITLGYSGTVPSGSFVKYTASASYGDITYSNINNGNVLTMPDADVTVNATLMPVVTYLDADGIAQQCSDYNVITSFNDYIQLGDSGKTHWYVVSSNATINGVLSLLDATANLILCDGATLAVNNYNYNNYDAVIANDLNIFGQSYGNGTLNATASVHNGISSCALGIYGGIISASGTNEGIYARYYPITLGYTAPANRITASSYSCGSLTVKAGLTLTDGAGHLYSNEINNPNLHGVTLQPAYSITLSDTDFTVTGTTAHQGYAPAGETVTLHTDAGYTITSASYAPAGGSATTINAEQGVWSFSMPTANTTVAATKEANTYTVHFNANATNGINATGTMDDQVLTYDQAQNLTTNAFTREGYTFAGWNTQPDGTGTAYTDGQEVNNLTAEQNGVVSLYAQWSIIDWTGTGTSENNPYVITFASQLVKLSNDVNGGNKCTGLFIKLDNDIDMNGVAFDGIGSRLNYFEGTFDGDGHTISNVTIDRSNDSDVVGFFGHISEGTVKNLIIDGASITGKNYVGGIIGYLYKTTISNCLVLNTSITVTSGNKCGVYGFSGGSLTLTNNHYKNCTVTIGETTNTTNIGVSSNDLDGVRSNDLDGVRSVHTLALPEHVTATGETVTIKTTTYYASDVQVTLSHDQNYPLANVKVNGTAATTTDDGYTWIFTMPAADATVTCGKSEPYIDVDGNLSYCNNFTTIESSTGDVSFPYDDNGWYVVSGNVTINGELSLYGDNNHLILCDGAMLTINQTNNCYGIECGGNLFIYGQSVGNGTLTVSALGVGLNTNNDLNINGGIINATSTTSDGINAVKNITINRGNVTAHGYDDGIRGANIIINGGTVKATKGEGNNVYGIEASQYSIILGYTELTDHITASSYYSISGTVSVKAGQFLTDGTAAYSGTLNDDQINAIAGQTLQPYFSITLPEHVVATAGVISQDGTTAYALPGATVTLSVGLGIGISGLTIADVSFTDNGDDTYTFSMPAKNVTVSATITDLWGIGAGNDGSSADKAYTITTTAGMELLATKRNAGNDFSGKYFKLGGNIEYDSSIENNHTAIGTNTNPFNGIFDGNGYTVSGIKIQSDESYQGLFGVVASGGVVRNVVVQGADIRGNNYVGGVVGKIYGILENCFVVETLVSGKIWVGIIWGDYDWGSLKINCHYLNCCNTHWDSGFTRNDMYTITAGTDVLLSINSYDRAFEYKGVLYFPYNANVSLDLSYTGTVPEGNVPVFFANGGSLSRTDNSYTLLVYDNDTIYAMMGKPNISYIDSIGTVHVCPAAVPITDHEGDIEYEGSGWFYVDGQVTVNGTISFKNDCHLILCDGATLSADAIIGVNHNDIVIYAQSSGNDMGGINSGFYVCGSLSVYGGKITTKELDIDELKGVGIYANEMGMYSGIINTMGDSIICGCMSLGWRNTTDSVTAGGYRSSYLVIYPGQVFTDGNDFYYGYMDDPQIDELSGKTLIPYQPYNITESDGVTDANVADIAGRVVSFSRDYTEDIATTICLPFSISNLLVGHLFKFVDVTYNIQEGWIATMEEIEMNNDGNLDTETEAGKPYLFLPFYTGTWSFVGRVPDDISPVAGATTSGDWTFHGTYSRKDYGDEGFSGTVFGFAGKNGKATDGVTDVEAGQFVKAGNGAYILPFRAYLTYSGSNTALHAPGRGTAEIPAIPDRIKVRLLGSDGGTTATGTIDMNTGEITIDQWYYLNGQPVEGAPAAPGLYLNSDGKKVMLTE